MATAEAPLLGYSFRPIGQDDLDRAWELENIGFPPDEAASADAVRYRYSVAPELFVGAYDDCSGELIGFINATRSRTECLDHDSLTNHDDSGNVVLLHSISVHPSHRRRSVATNLLKYYIKRCQQAGNSAILLACHDELKTLYTGAGFIDRGLSDCFVHGSRPWNEMAVQFNVRQTNTKDLLCPVERCRCLILRRGVGQLIARAASPLPPSPIQTNHNYPSCWAVSSPLKFENVGFSKPVTTSDSQPLQMRWLTCAACDFAPIGWTQSATDLAQQFSRDPNGTFNNVDFLLDCARVHPSDDGAEVETTT